MPPPLGSSCRRRRGFSELPPGFTLPMSKSPQDPPKNGRTGSVFFPNTSSKTGFVEELFPSLSQFPWTFLFYKPSQVGPVSALGHHSPARRSHLSPHWQMVAADLGAIGAEVPTAQREQHTTSKRHLKAALEVDALRVASEVSL